MVEAPGNVELLPAHRVAGSMDGAFYGSALAEVKGRPVHGNQAYRQMFPVVDADTAGVNGQLLAQRGVVKFAGQVPVGVAGQVEIGGPVRSGLIFDGKAVFIRQGIAHPVGAVPRPSVQPVGLGGGQQDGGCSPITGEVLHCPELC